MEKLQKGRMDKVLNRRTNYGGMYGTVTRRQFLEDRLAEGWKLEEVSQKDYAKIERLESSLRALDYIPGLSNPLGTLGQTHKRLNHLIETAVKLEWRIVAPEGNFFTITKTEYKYGLGLQEKNGGAKA